MASSFSSSLEVKFLLVVTMAAIAHGCTFQDGFHFPGNTLSTVNSIESRESCCLECRNTIGCIAFTFYVSGANANKCLLKYAINNPVADASVSSGISTGVCSFGPGIEYPQFSISTFPDVPNKETCCYWCTATTKCVAFTYFASGPKANQCELKFAVNNKLLSSTDTVAGTMAATSSQCTYETGLTYRGLDLKSVAGVASKEDCCKACKGTPNCTAFNYALSGPNSKTCALKYTTLNVTNSLAVSGTATINSCNPSLPF